MDVLSNVLERTAFEGWLLEMMSVDITKQAARDDAEHSMREHYAAMATLTAISVESMRLINHDCKSEEMCQLTAKVKSHIERLSARYESLSKRPQPAPQPSATPSTN